MESRCTFLEVLLLCIEEGMQMIVFTGKLGDFRKYLAELIEKFGPDAKLTEIIKI